MATKINLFIASALLEICKKKPLKDITVTELLEYTGISRKTFYRYYKDKNDLICWIYTNKVLLPWNNTKEDFDYYLTCIDYFTRFMEFKSFFMQAYQMTDQNNLYDFTINAHIKWENEYFKNCYGSNQILENVNIIAEYVARGAAQLTYKWIMSDTLSTPTEIAQTCCCARNTCLSFFIPKEYNLLKTNTACPGCKLTGNIDETKA